MIRNTGINNPGYRGNDKSKLAKAAAVSQSGIVPITPPIARLKTPIANQQSLVSAMTAAGKLKPTNVVNLQPALIPINKPARQNSGKHGLLPINPVSIGKRALTAAMAIPSLPLVGALPALSATDVPTYSVRQNEIPALLVNQHALMANAQQEAPVEAPPEERNTGHVNLNPINVINNVEQNYQAANNAISELLNDEQAQWFMDRYAINSNALRSALPHVEQTYEPTYTEAFTRLQYTADRLNTAIDANVMSPDDMGRGAKLFQRAAQDLKETELANLYVDIINQNNVPNKSNTQNSAIDQALQNLNQIEPRLANKIQEDLKLGSVLSQDTQRSIEEATDFNTVINSIQAVENIVNLPSNHQIETYLPTRVIKSIMESDDPDRTAGMLARELREAGIRTVFYEYNKNNEAMASSDYIPRNAIVESTGKDPFLTISQQLGKEGIEVQPHLWTYLRRHGQPNMAVDAVLQLFNGVKDDPNMQNIDTYTTRNGDGAQLLWIDPRDPDAVEQNRQIIDEIGRKYGPESGIQHPVTHIQLDYNRFETGQGGARNAEIVTNAVNQYSAEAKEHGMELTAAVMPTSGSGGNMAAKVGQDYDTWLKSGAIDHAYIMSYSPGSAPAINIDPQKTYMTLVAPVIDEDKPTPVGREGYEPIYRGIFNTNANDGAFFSLQQPYQTGRILNFLDTLESMNDRDYNPATYRMLDLVMEGRDFSGVKPDEEPGLNLTGNLAILYDEIEAISTSTETVNGQQRRTLDGIATPEEIAAIQQKALLAFNDLAAVQDEVRNPKGTESYVDSVINNNLNTHVGDYLNSMTGLIQKLNAAGQAAPENSVERSTYTNLARLYQRRANVVASAQNQLSNKAKNNESLYTDFPRAATSFREGRLVAAEARNSFDRHIGTKVGNLFEGIENTWNSMMDRNKPVQVAQAPQEPQEPTNSKISTNAIRNLVPSGGKAVETGFTLYDVKASADTSNIVFYTDSYQRDTGNFLSSMPGTLFIDDLSRHAEELGYNKFYIGGMYATYGHSSHDEARGIDLDHRTKFTESGTPVPASKEDIIRLGTYLLENPLVRKILYDQNSRGFRELQERFGNRVKHWPGHSDHFHIVTHDPEHVEEYLKAPRIEVTQETQKPQEVTMQQPGNDKQEFVIRIPGLRQAGEAIDNLSDGTIETLGTGAPNVDNGIDVLVRAGHSGNNDNGTEDVGATGQNTKIVEDDVTIKAAEEYVRKLNEQGYNATLFTGGYDAFGREIDRVNPDFAFDIHANSTDNGEGTGVEVLYSGNANFAAILTDGMANVTGSVARTPVKADNYGVPMRTDSDTVAVIPEIGFVNDTNIAGKYDNIADPNYINDVTDGLLNGLNQYVQERGQTRTPAPVVSRQIDEFRTNPPAALQGKLEPGFIDNLIESAGSVKDSNVRPECLISLQYFESAGSMSPSQPNLAGSGAMGSLQILPSVALELGTTTAELAAMSQAEYQQYVTKYLNMQVDRYGPLNTFEDLAASVIWPRAVGKPNDYVIIDKSQAPETYEQNAGLDKNKDGIITKEEYFAAVATKAKNELGIDVYASNPQSTVVPQANPVTHATGVEDFFNQIANSGATAQAQHLFDTIKNSAIPALTDAAKVGTEELESSGVNVDKENGTPVLGRVIESIEDSMNGNNTTLEADNVPTLQAPASQSGLRINILNDFEGTGGQSANLINSALNQYVDAEGNLVQNPDNLNINLADTDSNPQVTADTIGNYLKTANPSELLVLVGSAGDSQSVRVLERLSQQSTEEFINFRQEFLQANPNASWADFLNALEQNGIKGGPGMLLFVNSEANPNISGANMIKTQNGVSAADSTVNAALTTGVKIQSGELRANVGYRPQAAPQLPQTLPHESQPAQPHQQTSPQTQVPQQQPAPAQSVQQQQAQQPQASAVNRLNNFASRRIYPNANIG